MRRLENLLIGVGIVLLTAFEGMGQDIHFSQYNSAPLFLNPALTGVNGCDYRFAANYKNQWSGVAPYRTIAGSFDMALGRRTPYSNFGGIGIMLYSDKAGDADFKTNKVDLSGSYTFMLNAKGTQYITGGIQAGVAQRSINVNALTFDTQFDPVNGFNSSGSTYETLPSDNLTFSDVGAGFLWSLHTGAGYLNNFYAGLAVTHLNQPNQSFLDDKSEKLYMKATLHGGAHIAFSKQFFMLPSFMVLKQGPNKEYNVGTLFKFKKSILPTEKTAFYIGALYRISDAVIFQGRMDFRVGVADLNIGLSYDLNISGLTPATNGNGGPEVSFIYTGCFSRKNMTRFCPPLL